MSLKKKFFSYIANSLIILKDNLMSENLIFIHIILGSGVGVERLRKQLVRSLIHGFNRLFNPHVRLLIVLYRLHAL